MQNSKTFLVRNLVPKSYHFDGYNELKCPNPRDKPFFTDNVIPMGGRHLTIRIVNQNTIQLEFSSVCPDGKITFDPFKLTLEEYVSKLKQAIQDGSDFITFEIQPKYHCNSSSRKGCHYRNKDCSQLTSKLPTSIYAAVSFNSSEVKEALAAYFEITKTFNGGKTTMKKNNNLFGMSFELGASKDPNISATLMGVAVKNKESGNWFTFDPASNSLKNLANFKMGSFPILLLPTKELACGDLIKHNGRYLYVKSVNANKTLTVIDAATGVIQEMLPEENIILGMTLYTKVVAFDAKTLTDPNSNQNLGGNVLAAIAITHWANGGQDEFSLDSINDDSFNGLGAFMPLILASGNSAGGIFAGANGNVDFSKLIAFGALSGDGNSDNDIAKMLVVSQLLGGSNSLFSGLTSFTDATAATEDTVVCEECKASYPAGTNFCSKCGGKTKSTASACRKCGTTLNKDAAFCHNCGTKVTADTCHKCGSKVDANAKFCSNCGANLNDVEVIMDATDEN